MPSPVLSKLCENDAPLGAADVRELVTRACPVGDYSNKKVLLIVPDGTRTAPLGLLFQSPARADRRGDGGVRCDDRARHASADERGGDLRAARDLARGAARRYTAACVSSITSGTIPRRCGTSAISTLEDIARADRRTVRDGCAGEDQRAASSITTSSSSSGRCSRTRSSASPAATNISSPASAGRRC